MTDIDDTSRTFFLHVVNEAVGEGSRLLKEVRGGGARGEGYTGARGAFLSHLALHRLKLSRLQSHSLDDAKWAARRYEGLLWAPPTADCQHSDAGAQQRHVALHEMKSHTGLGVLERQSALPNERIRLRTGKYVA